MKLTEGRVSMKSQDSTAAEQDTGPVALEDVEQEREEEKVPPVIIRMCTRQPAYQRSEEDSQLGTCCGFLGPRCEYGIAAPYLTLPCLTVGYLTSPEVHSAPPETRAGLFSTCTYFAASRLTVSLGRRRRLARHWSHVEQKSTCLCPRPQSGQPWSPSHEWTPHVGEAHALHPQLAR